MAAGGRVTSVCHQFVGRREPLRLFSFSPRRDRKRSYRKSVFTKFSISAVSVRGLHMTSSQRNGGHSDLFFARYALGSKAARMASDETLAQATHTLLRFSPVLYEHTSALLCYTPTFDSSVFTKDARCKNHHEQKGRQHWSNALRTPSVY